MKKIISSVILAGMACAVFATDARVETMGRNSNFFQDETQIHQNAANLGLYDKIMYGSYGEWGGNRPEFPYFGAAVTMGQFSVGATFNRVDSALNYVAKNVDALGLRTSVPGATGTDARMLVFAGNDVNSFGDRVSNQNLDFVGKIDLMTAYTLPNGTTIGLGGYLAFQDGSIRDLTNITNRVPLGSGKELQNRFVKCNVGVNTPIGDGVDLEASIGISTLTLRGTLGQPIGDEPSFFHAADNDVGIQIDVRMFSDIAAINGAFVPNIKANIFNYGDNDRIIDFSAGLGINLNIDRGFFWAGLEGLYNKTSNTIVRVDGNTYQTGGAYDRSVTFGKKDVIGGRVGFGIERNVLTDWFVIRVGGQKLLAKESRGNNGGSKWLDTHDQDHVSLGMGVNIEDRLKIDFTVSENLPYTFTGLFSNSTATPYLASRVSAVFSF